MNKRTVRLLGYALLVPAIMMVVLLAFAGLAAIIAPPPADGHEEPAVYPPHENTDSLRVMVEIDGDGDGFWEVRHVFNDKRGVWEVGAWGSIRITTTVQTDSMGYADTDLYTFRLMKDPERYWRMTAAKLDSSLSQVLLGEFSQFGQSYGDSLYTDPSTGEVIFQSPNYNWTLVPRESEVGHD